MSQWQCSVCGYSHDDTPPPARCPVCGAAQNKREGASTDPANENGSPAPPASPVRQWLCQVCGYIHEGVEPPDKCPVCGADRSRFVALDATEESAPQAAAEGTARRWQCTVCGYVHIGPEPPEKCPVCGTDRSKFILLEEPSGTAEETPSEETAAGETPSSESAAVPPPSPLEQFLSRHRRLIDFAIANHAHPITVHIPNGVLPVAVAMVLLNALFDLPALGKAAFYNMIFILAAMPAVLLTGYLHWRFKFGGHITALFKGKIVCGSLVFLFAAVLVLWPLLDASLTFQPSILYVLLHLAMMAAGTVAGWLGGRLVFHRKA